MSTKRKAKGFVPQKKPSALQLAGKSISAKNAGSLVAAKNAIAAGLGSLNEILETAGLLEEQIEASASDWEESGLLGCSSWEDYMRRSFWYNKLESVLGVFSYYFEASLYYKSQGKTDEEFGSPDELKTSLMTFLQELEDSFGTTLLGATAIQAAAIQDADELVTFTVPSLTLLQSGTSLNRLPIEGMLFQCDVVSEGVPAKGPGKRLMIPRSVALKAVDQIPSLPLDADPSLRRHCNDSIVGTMLSARIKEDNGFWISGNLFPWSQPEIVAAIRASKHEMGFSINAYTRGHDEQINSETVHVIDELTLVGANILYADSATFSSTKLVTAAIAITEIEPSVSVIAEAEIEPSAPAIAEIPEAINTEPTVLIAATVTPEPSTSKDEQIMEELLKALGEQVAAQGQSVSSLRENMNVLTEGLGVLLQDRQAQQAQLAKAEEIAQAKTQEEAIAAKVLALLSSNGNSRAGQPARIVPVQASVTTLEDSDPVAKIKLLQAELAGLKSANSFSSESMKKQIALTDQIGKLKHVAGMN